MSRAWLGSDEGPLSAFRSPPAHLVHALRLERGAVGKIDAEPAHVIGQVQAGGAAGAGSACCVRQSEQWMQSSSPHPAHLPTLIAPQLLTNLHHLQLGGCAAGLKLTGAQSV